MAEDFIGVIIEESLKDKAVLKKIKIIKTKTEKVTERHQTPYLKKWTLHTVRIPADEAEKIAKEISESFGAVHSGWYADFKNRERHYIIFPGKIFRVDRSKKENYTEAVKHGLSLGIPDYQLVFTKSPSP